VTTGFTEQDEWEDAGSLESDGHVGPWPAFVDLFAATTLVLLVFFVVIASRYIGEVGDVVRVQQLYDQMEQLQEQGRGFTVEKQGADVLLVLEERVTFHTNDADLLPPAREVLRQVADLLQRKQFNGLVREIEILGHADRRGDAFRNWQLSANRAVSVAQFLVDSIKVSPCTVIASGRGAYFPRDSALRPEILSGREQLEAYARDRRVEVLLHPVVAKDRSVGRSGCRRSS
jgi:outer membrane protein OmpA-like peptidoglycan-associated protein